MSEDKKWWHKAVIYQIYPRSFSDSNNNGIGDLRGIINRLDYLKDLGIDAIWFSPFYPSPQEDFGYDITDFGAVNPEYGTMNDFDELLVRTHKLGIKVILDMILNHSSDKHPWFLESKKDKTNPKHDWYIWSDGVGRKKNKPPNNWHSIIGGSAWEWCDERQQFYLHQFLKCQPDLNWWNPDVQETMFNYIRFWLDKGIDGYRLDIIHTLFEDKELRNNPFSKQFFPNDATSEKQFQKPVYTQFLPETIDVCIKLREIIDVYSPERVLIGEAVENLKIIRPLYGTSNNGLNMVFNFHLGAQPFTAKKIQSAILNTEKEVADPLWPCYALSNHDFVRMISRHKNDIEKSKIMIMFLLTLRGTPVVYYGEEIGMPQVKIPLKKQLDPIAHHVVWGIPVGLFFARDGCRTPMQWNNSQINAGFSVDSNVKPWLPIAPNSVAINVENQYKDQNSLLNYFKKLITIRKKYKSLHEGSLKIVSNLNTKYISYEREFKNEKICVIVNMTKKKQTVSLPYKKATQLLSTHSDKTKEFFENIQLLPYEGVIIKSE
ncbi:MAG: alpha-amylase family glycosyl hydrolase [Candidatus Thorarchaeota archaeon]